MSEYILEMRDVTKKFPGVIALNEVRLQLKKGEILGICGENGAGKSTLMKILSGTYPYGTYKGEILYNGKPIKISDVATAQNLGIEMIYQEINMVLESSIEENLFLHNLPVKNHFVDFKRLHRETKEILDQIGIEASPKDRVGTLNSGQMQMIALMRAYIKHPKILVLDEPTSALANAEIEQLMKILKSLREQGVSCIYISHKLDEIYKICDRVMVLRDGHTIGVHDIHEVDQSTLIEEMVGRKIENLYPKTVVEIGQEAMRVEHLSVPHPTIKGKNIVDDISFNVHKGEILGIGGLVGAGRSETLAGIFGQLQEGVHKKVFINEKEVRIQKPADAINAGIGFVTEERKLNGFVWMLSIRDNMFLASLKELAGKGPFIDAKEENQRCQNMFDKLRIKAPSINTKVNTLSGGNQQKVVLSKWLVRNPDILFVDEPTKGVDVGAKAEIYSLLGELVSQGIAIVMVSSDLPELLAISDRVLVMNSGKIVKELDRNQFSETAVMSAAIK